MTDHINASEGDALETLKKTWRTVFERGMSESEPVVHITPEPARTFLNNVTCISSLRRIDNLNELICSSPLAGWTSNLLHIQWFETLDYCWQVSLSCVIRSSESSHSVSTLFSLSNFKASCEKKDIQVRHLGWRSIIRYSVKYEHCLFIFSCPKCAVRVQICVTLLFCLSDVKFACFQHAV